MAERQEYLEDIEEAIKLGLHAAGPECNGSLSYKGLRDILIKMDPGLSDSDDSGPQHQVYGQATRQLEAMLVAGFENAVPATEFETTTVRADQFVKRLLKMPLRRCQLTVACVLVLLL